ncbi:MAG: hypothetical protein KC462_07225, partial [Cyanobacteria bacterium HKST-UBA05]|nr:hypothetical protein [Cyanobacteria bacterium HKST-UBA05]
MNPLAPIAATASSNGQPSPSRLQKAGLSKAALSATANRTPQFGFNPRLAQTATESFGLRASNTLARIFRPVLENIFAGIMVVDVFCYWIPRVWGALTRGAFDYDPDRDPQAYGKQGWDRQKHVLNQRLKGLNWINAWEETMREVASGPALFIWPSILYMMLKPGFGKRAAELPHAALTQLSDGFTEAAQHQGLTEKLQPRQFKIAFARMVRDMFDDDRMRATNRRTKPGQPLESYGAFFQSWSSRLTNALWRQKKEPRKSAKALADLKHELLKAVQIYNRKHHAESRFYHYEKMPLRFLQRHVGKDGKTVSLAAKTELTHVGQWFDNLQRFGDLAMEVEKLKATSPSTPIIKLMEGARQRMIRRKAAFSLSAIGITLVFLFRLVNWAQSSNSYVANRRLQLDKLDLESVKQQISRKQNTPEAVLWPAEDITATETSPTAPMPPSSNWPGAKNKPPLWGIPNMPQPTQFQ